MSHTTPHHTSLFTTPFRYTTSRASNFVFNAFISLPPLYTPSILATIALTVDVADRDIESGLADVTANMELQRERSPAYQSHNPEDLKLPAVPRSDIPSARSPSDVTLPDLRSVLGELPSKTVHPNVLLNAVAQEDHGRNSQLPNDHRSRTLPKLDSSAPTYNGGRTSMESAVVSPTDTSSVMSMEGRGHRSTSVVSLEDPDVRLAAEALSGLGNSGKYAIGRMTWTNVKRITGFIRSPHAQSSQKSPSAVSNGGSMQQQPPLLELFVDAHPWVGSTIASSMTAYNTTKNYSPRIVQYGAGLIERNIGSPVANTVSSVGRRTGVESGLRKILGNRRADELERPDSADSARATFNKRRKTDSDEMDLEEPAASEVSRLQDSQEFLPAYRSSKPPSYREEMSPRGTDRTIDRPQHNRSWSSHVIYTASGLGVALSDSSLRSLKYCVGLLVSATDHVQKVMDALRLVLQEYDQVRDARQADQARRTKEIEAGFSIKTQEEKDHEVSEQLAQRIKQLCDDILNTIKTVVNSVSTYAGGALPENARNIVKGQLLSIPQRWRWATESAAAADQQEKADGGESGGSGSAEEDTRKAAHRMLAFATEGLDMMAQVNAVVNTTLQKAEEWLETLRRRNQDHEMMDADDPRDNE